MRPEAPIIIIGNGRSGSSLLDTVLGAHPEIAMFGEFRFAVAETWRAMAELFRNASSYRLLDYFNAHPGAEQEAAAAPALMRQIADALEPERDRRRGAIVRRAVADALYLDGRLQAHWVFKEIFNSGQIDWAIYDLVFPEAIWVHIVRNPVEFARSAIWHLRQQATDETIGQFLAGWATVFAASRTRAGTGRYCEIRYEALTSDPQRALAPLFETLGLDWHESCARAAGQQVGARSDRFALPDHLPALIAAVPELPGIMAELGYAAPAAAGTAARAETEPPHLTPAGDSGWRLRGQIWPEEGRAWQFDLDRTPLSAELAAIADDVDLWTRSPLRLFEDGRPLGPAHALHRLIRGTGGGAYSHWQQRLLFSTSDNTNPNRNGRVYAFDLAG